jgi:hypothetical protein
MLPIYSNNVSRRAERGARVRQRTAGLLGGSSRNAARWERWRASHREVVRKLSGFVGPADQIAAEMTINPL